ncbi:MAG: DUF998 domain-containing protein [Dehalococcoidia bacterium]
MVRILGFIAAVGPVVFVLGIVAAGAVYPGYDHVDQMISELGGADATHPWLQNMNFVLFGLSVVGLALALVLDAHRLLAGAVLLAALGIFGTTLEGIVHCDSGCLGNTAEGQAHLVSGLFGFVCGITALFLLARHWRNDPRWSAHARLTRRLAWLALIGLIVFVASDATPRFDGLAQRVFVAPLLVFCASTGWRLFRLASTPAGAHDREAAASAA